MIKVRNALHDLNELLDKSEKFGVRPEIRVFETHKGSENIGVVFFTAKAFDKDFSYGYDDNGSY
jgi:hypothetical protein